MKHLIIITALVLTISLISCKKEETPENQKPPAEFITTYKTKVPEPSDLTFSYNKKALWTVSDETNKAYLISFEGEILEEIQLKGKDPEGITVLNDSSFAVVFERDRVLAKYTLSGDEIFRKKFDEFKGELNAGFEGITLNPKNGHFYLVNEKYPRLFIELDPDLNVIKKNEITYAEDYSGIFYDETKNQLWIISDENNMIGQCDFDGNLLDSFRVTVPQMEGIAVDHQTKRIYAISDITGELFVYKILD